MVFDERTTKKSGRNERERKENARVVVCKIVQEGLVMTSFEVAAVRRYEEEGI